MSQLVAAEFVDFLVAVCEADGNTTYATTLLTAARAAIAGSGGGLSQLTSSGINGKTFSRAVQLSAVEVAVSCQRAIAIYSNTSTQDISSSYADFSAIQH